MQLPDRLLYLFKQYMDKTCTPEEKDELMEYVNSGKYDHLLRELLNQGWNHPLPPYEQATEKANYIFNTIIAEKALPSKSRNRMLVAIKYVAAAMILLVTGWAVYHYYNKPASTVVAQKNAPVSMAPEHQYIALPDGSKVLLNAGSQLNYPDTFGNTREVHLTGEGYFDIRHDDKKPFIVYAGNTKTIVLGTAFNIKAFPGQKNVIVTVIRGKVRVERDQQLAGIITKNQQIVVNETSEVVKTEMTDTGEAIAWKQDDILLDDVPLKRAAIELEQRFNCSIEFSKPALANCSVTASFLHHETLEQVLQVITRINGMEYHIGPANKIMLSGDGCFN
jgi:ferric-dicitrate binding protein FerR (iron transport regulator)